MQNMNTEIVTAAGQSFVQARIITPLSKVYFTFAVTK